MKSKLFFIMACSAAFILSCNNNKDKDPDPLTEVPAHNFTDQELQGEFSGEPWVFQSGSSKSAAQGTYVSIHLSDTTSLKADTCGGYGYGDKQLSLFLPAPLQQKVYGLAKHLYSCQFVESGKDGLYATGALEILSISNDTVKGRIEATIDTENSVNGNFAVRVCP